MKNAITLIYFVFILSSCSSPKKEFTLIGKWQKTEYQESSYSSNNGTGYYVEKVENGEVLIFINNTIVKDGLGNKGTYELNGNRLHICLNENESFYRFYPDGKDPEKIYLSPLTPEYRIICDEGCAYVYEKIK